MSIRSISNLSMELLRYADSTRDLDRIGEVITVVIGVEKNPQNSLLQQIEKVFRKNNCWTYLIARRPEGAYTADIECVWPEDLSKRTYYLYMTTLDKSEAMKEVEKESLTYKENLKKLKYTGFAMFKEGVPVSKQVINQNDIVKRIDPLTGLSVSSKFRDYVG